MDINLQGNRKLSESDCARIRDIKRKIVSMLKERRALDAGSTAQPSELWSNTCACFDYLLDLPESHFGRLRTHTYHITSDNYLLYNGKPAGFRETWDLETQGVPDSYRLDEPEGGIGFHYPDGRFLSKDILRFQTVVSDLYRHKVMDHLCNLEDRVRILEIGAGYGGLLHHLGRIRKNSTCVILDLPETLIFSAAYLTLLNPEKKIYLYDKEDYAEFTRSNALATCDFVLLPNYLLETLGESRFDLVLNVVSMGEMRLEQVQQYLDFIHKTCRGFFYSYNADRHVHNHEMTELSGLLHDRFNAKELRTPNNPLEKVAVGFRNRARRGLRRLARTIGVVPTQAQTAIQFPYRRYLCTPRREPAEMRQQEGTGRLPVAGVAK